MVKLIDKIKSFFNMDSESLAIFTSIFTELKIKKYDSFAKKGEFSTK
jgi:hypothetical protein